MKDTLPPGPCPECFYLGYKGKSPVFICSNLADANKIILNCAPYDRHANEAEIRWVKTKFSQFFNKDGTLSDLYFGLRKLLR